MPVFLNVSPNKNLTDLADQTDGKPYAFFGDELELEEDLDSALFDVSKFWNGDCIIQVHVYRFTWVNRMLSFASSRFFFATEKNHRSNCHALNCFRLLAL